MHVTLFSNFDTLRSFSDDWDRLAAGNPFRSWAWHSAWWQAYGEGDQEGKPRLWTLGVLDEQNRLRGIAPWYCHQSKTKGAVISFLGSGDVCTDHLGIMAAPGDESAVVNLISDFLLDPSGNSSSGMPEASDRRQLGRWDLLHFDGIDNEDTVMNLFAERLDNENRLTFHRKPGLSCWRLELPSDIKTFLQPKSKNFKKMFKRAKKTLEKSSDLQLDSAKNLDEFKRYLDFFIDLHQRRRTAIGEPGCFASSRFEKFFRDASIELFRAGQVNIYTIFREEKPIVVDYNLFGNGIAYSYQSGMDPDYLNLGPGSLIHVALIEHYQQQGMIAWDFLRGDEEYKQRWKAEKRLTSIWHVAAPHWTARCRDLLRRASEEFKATAKRGLQQVTSK